MTINFEKASLAWALLWDADWITAVSFCGNRRVAAGNNLGQILVWDLPEKAGGTAPKPVRRLDGHTNVICRLLPTPDGKSLLSSSYDHTIRYWDAESSGAGSATIVLNVRKRDEISKQRYGGKVPNPIDAPVKLQQCARTLTGHHEWVSGMSLSRDGKQLLSADDGGHAIVWDREAGKELCRWKLKNWAYAVALSPDGKQALLSERVPLIFDSGRRDAVNLWDATTGTVKHDLSAAFKMYLSAAAFSPDGKVLAVGRGGEVDGLNGKVFLVDPATGKKERELSPGHEHGITDLAFHPDGKHLASSGRDTRVCIWDAASGKLVKELGKPRGGQSKDWIHAVSFSPDGQWLAAADMAGSVQVWSLG